MAPSNPRPYARTSVITRSEIGLPTARTAGPLGTVRGIIIHHSAEGHRTASMPGCPPAVGAAAVAAVRLAHLARGWADTGYHYLIDGAGRIYQGRAYVTPGALGPGLHAPGLAVGAHTSNHNTGQIGVCVLGCFDPVCRPHRRGSPTPEALSALGQLCRALVVAYGVGPVVLRGHRDYGRTACPGDQLYAHLPALRAASGAA